MKPEDVIPVDIIEEARELCAEDGTDPDYSVFTESDYHSYPMYINYLNDHWYSIFFNYFDRNT